MNGAIQEALPMPTYDQPQETQDTQRTAYEIVDMYENHELRLPYFQREVVWSDSKRMSFVERFLRSSIRPLGVIVTYEIAGSPGRVFLLDGLQRVSTLVDLKNDRAKYGESVYASNRQLLNRSMSVQHRIYENHQEAMADFQLLNSGTALTPYEFYKGTLEAKGDMLEKLHEAIADVLKYNQHEVPQKRETRHHHFRHNYVLLYTFLTKDDALRRWQVKKSLTDDPMRISQEQIEQKLYDLIRHRSDSETCDAIAALKKEMVNSFSHFFEVWNTRTGSDSRNKRPPLSVMRWLMLVFVWGKNNNKTTSDFAEFFESLAAVYAGETDDVIVSGGQFLFANDDDSDPEKITLSVFDLTKLKDVCRIIHSTFHETINVARRKKDNTFSPVPGHERRHVEPFSTNGEGETFYGAAAPNRAKGAALDPNPYKGS